jgi:hypothetical protein
MSGTLAGCGTGTTTVSSSREGLTSAEAAKLAWKTGGKIFTDAVLWRMIPSSDPKSTNTQLTTGWQESDRSAGWFVWLADRASGDWYMIGIQGTQVTYTNLSTREFSATPMGADWPNDHLAVAMKDAAKVAAAQGADLAAVTWAEYACDYPTGSYTTGRPMWVFSCSETLSSGAVLDYRILVDGVSGDVVGALNNLNERMTLPIDRVALQKQRAVNHEADVREFFDFISEGKSEQAVRQLAYTLAPSDTMRQQWLDNFRSLSSLTVVSVEQASLEQWTAECEYYKVTLDVKTSEPSEKYGWENGRNVRWMTLIPQGAGPWKVSALAQNP